MSLLLVFRPRLVSVCLPIGGDLLPAAARGKRSDSAISARLE
jgi:hypothetical protein